MKTVEKEASIRAYQDANKANIETTAEGKSYLKARYQFWSKKLGGKKS